MASKQQDSYAVFKGHPKGVWHLIGMVIWEFFSFYGMRALLVLYLVQRLGFTDIRAYSLFGAYAALVYVFPTICGYIADKYIGYKQAVVLGGIFIAVGHFILALQYHLSLFIGLAFLVLGVGLFKTNSISLIGQFYSSDRLHRQSAFNLYYAGGNLGGFFASIGCGFVAIHYGWHYGFILAGLGMVVGLIVLLSGFQFFHGKGVSKVPKKRRAKTQLLFWLGIIISLVFVTVVLYFLLAGYVLSITILLTASYVILLTKRQKKKTRHELYLFYFLILGSLLFWSFDNQGSSSVTLFISRNINRMLSFGNFSYQIPTPMFQAINPLVILIAAPTVSLLWQRLGKRKIYPTTILKFTCAFILLTAGFYLLAKGAFVATHNTKANMLWPIGGLALVGIGEVFVDPVALAFVTRIAPKNAVSILTATYYLFSQALSGYLAAQIAKLTSLEIHKKVKTSLDFAKSYASVYEKITIICASAVILFIIFRLIFRKLSVK